LRASLEITNIAIASSTALLPPETPVRHSPAILDSKLVADEDEARSRMAMRVIDILSAAGMAVELRHLGVTLQ
jgi:hypothetical protein